MSGIPFPPTMVNQPSDGGIPTGSGGTADFGGAASYSWNVFRYLGDYIHVASIVVLLYWLVKQKSCKGFSQKTMILLLTTYICRYLDLFDHSQSMYLVFFKLLYIGSFAAVNYLFVIWANTIEEEHDTTSMAVCIIPALVGAFMLTEQYTMLEILWTFSEFLEAFALVPQYVFLYRNKCQTDMGQAMFVLCSGLYRIFYALNWIYKKAMMPHYSDIQSWLGGILEIGFFIDFLNAKFRGSEASFLASAVLTVDDNVNIIKEKVEDAIEEKTGVKLMGAGTLRRRRAKEENDIQMTALDV